MQGRARVVIILHGISNYFYTLKAALVKRGVGGWVRGVRRDKFPGPRGNETALQGTLSNKREREREITHFLRVVNNDSQLEGQI